MYWTITIYGLTFQNSSTRSNRTMSWSYYPSVALRQRWFGLLRVRSPLLAESLLFSPPMGTEMFQFPTFAPHICGVRPSTGRVAPFGNPRIKGYLLLPAAYRSLSRPSSPPRATGIRRAPFLPSFYLNSSRYSTLYSSRSRCPTGHTRLVAEPLPTQNMTLALASSLP